MTDERLLHKTQPVMNSSKAYLSLKKSFLIEGAPQLLVDLLRENPATTVVVNEVETDNWRIAGKSVTERRKGGK